MKIKILNCEKMENCFANAHSYAYTLSHPINDEVLSQMERWGEMTVKRNFRRPFFMLRITSGIQAKGVLNTDIIKAGYSGENWQLQKKNFENMLRQLSPGTRREVLSSTESVCPVCLKKIPAARIRCGDKVYLEKTCAIHGDFKTLIWNGLPAYETFHQERTGVSPVNPAVSKSRGCPDDCGLCPEHRQKTCCVLLEVTSRCSLGCPVCFASAGQTPVPDPSLEDIRHRYQEMMKCGGPFNIQLSGGEPAERDDLDEIIRIGKKEGFTFFQLNTNGIRIGREPEYLQRLADAGLNCVFLQFDGLTPETNSSLRGKKDLLQDKLAALESCKKAGIGVVLVPVIAAGVNTHEIGDILDFALEHMPVVRGVHFQPISYFGRCGLEMPEERFTLPDLLRAIEEQTEGRMKAENFSPGNAENPYCSFSGNFILQADKTLTPWGAGSSCGCRSGETHSDPEASRKSQAFVAKQWSAPKPVEPEKSCCCTSSLDDFLNRIRNYSLAVSAMTFMDAWNLDLERLRECYIHVVTGEDQIHLIPFCAYNLTALDGTTKYRGRENS